MWVIPTTYKVPDPQTSLPFAPDTVASKEDLALLESTIASSLMWRSKPSLLRTWLRRWSRISWIPPLFGRILKPSQHISFEAALTSSLAATRASRLAGPANDRARTIPVTSGRTSDNISEQLALFSASLKTSKGTSGSASTASSATWRKMVTAARGEYSARLKSARLTRGSASSSWETPYPTPAATRYGNNRGGAAGRTGKVRHSLESIAKDPAQPTGCLNPTWVEWLMGVPAGWTDLGSWATESCLRRQQKPGAN